MLPACFGTTPTRRANALTGREDLPATAYVLPSLSLSLSAFLLSMASSDLLALPLEESQKCLAHTTASDIGPWR